MDTKINIKKVADQLGMTVDAIRYYEKMELLTLKRNVAGYRCFSELDIRHLKYITVMRYANFSIKDIKFFMNLLTSPPSKECHLNTTEKFASKRKEIQETIDFLQKIDDLLAQIPDEVFDPDQQVDLNQQLFDHYIEDIFLTIRERK